MPYVCETFEPQTWRTDRCRHCYKTEVDHFIGAAAASLSKQSGGSTAVTATTAALAASIAASRNLASVATTPGAVSAFTASILSNAYKGGAGAASTPSAAAAAATGAKPAAKPSIAVTSTITPTVSSSVTAETLAALRRQYGITSSTPAATSAAPKTSAVAATTAVTAASTTTTSATKVSSAIPSPLTAAAQNNNNNKNASASAASFGFRRSVSRDITPRRSHSRDEKENDDGRPGPGRLRAMQEIIDDLRKEIVIQKQKQELSDREKNTTITKLRSQITDVESQRIALKAKTDVLQSKVDMAAKDKTAGGGGAAATTASYTHQVKIDELSRKLKDAEEKSKKAEDSQKMSILRLEARLAEAEVTKSRLKTEKETQLKEVRDSVQSLEANYQLLLKSEKEAKNSLKEKEERVKTLEKEVQLVMASGGGKNRPKSIADIPEQKRQELADSVLKGRNQDLEVEIQVVKNENDRLKNEAKDLQEEIDEMQDTFREDHAEEFRELQKELEITAKNCRILQYKLRKAERKGEITEAERAAYEEKIQSLTKQMEESGDKSATDSLKTELEMSKQISLKLHEEIDGLNKNKDAKEKENEKLTNELSQTKKWKESMEKELKELRNKVASAGRGGAGGYLKTQKSTDSSNDETVKLLEGDNEKLRWQIAEKERKVEELSAQVTTLENGGSPGGSSPIDIKKQLRMVEHEAGMLRQKLLQIEEDNEKLINQNRQLQMKSASRGRGSQIIAPDSSFMENIELKEKVANLEKELKLLKLNAGADVKDVEAAEVAMKMARQIASLEAEIHKLKKDQKKDDAVKGTDTGEKDLKHRIAALEQENGDLTLMIKSKETLLTKVEADLSTTRKELEKIKMASSDKHDAEETKEKIASMKQRLDALTQLKDKTQEQYEHANGELATEKKKKQEIENELKQAELKAKSLQDQVDTLQAKLAAQQKSQLQRPGTVLVSDEAMKNLEKERDKYRSSATEAESKLSAAQAALKNNETKLAEKQQAIKDLEEKWEAEKSYLEVSLDNERKTIERENKQHQEKVRTLEEIIKGKDELISSKEETLNDKESNIKKYEESSKNALQEKDKKIQEVEGRLIRSEKTVKELQIRLYQLEQSRKDVANRLKELGKKVEKQDKSYKTLERELKEERTSQKLEKQLFEEKFIHASTSLEKANKKLKEKEESWKQEKETLNAKLKEEKDKGKDLERTKEALEYNVWANEKKDLQDKISKIEKGHATEREAWEKERGFLSAAGNSNNNNTGKVSGQFLEELESLKLQLAAEKENTKARLEKEDKLWQAEITGLKMKNQSEIKMMRESQKTLQGNVERLTKEREVLKDILDGAQRNIAEVKSRYLSDAELWEVERANLISQTIEIDDVKKQMSTMRREMELMSDNYAKEKRLRTGLENKHSVEKNVWEMSQVQLNNRIRQLEDLVSKAPKKTKEMQTKLDSGLEKERAEMKRLIESNNEINGKLMEEIQSTKIAKEGELTELKTRFEKERQTWEKERYAVQKRNQELEQMANLMLLTQRRLEDLQWEYGAAAEMWAYERDELQELLNDSERHIFRDREKLDELLLELEKFRRIAPVLENFMIGGEEGGVPPAGGEEQLDERWRKKVTQVMKHVEQMSDDLLNYKTAVANGSPPPMKRTISDPEQVGGERSERRGSLPDLVVDQGPKTEKKEKKEASDPEADKRSTRWRSPARKPKLLKRQSSADSTGGGSRSPSRWSMASGGSRGGSRAESPTRYYSRYNYLHSREGSIYGGSDAGSDDSRGGSRSGSVGPSGRGRMPSMPSIIFNRRGKRGSVGGGGGGGDKWETSSIGSGAGLQTLSNETASTFEEKLRNIGNWTRQVSEEAEDPSSFRETNVDTGESKTAFRHPASVSRRSSSPSVSYLSYHNRQQQQQPFDYDAASIGAGSGFATPSLRPSVPSQSDIHRAFGRQTSESKLASSAAYDDAQPSKVGPTSLRVPTPGGLAAASTPPVDASKFKTNSYDKEPAGATTTTTKSGAGGAGKTATASSSSSTSTKAAPAASKTASSTSSSADKGRASTPSWRSGFGAFKEATPAAEEEKKSTKPTQPGIGNLMKRFESKDAEAEAAQAARATGNRGDTPVPRTQVDREKAEKNRSGGVVGRLFRK